MKTEDVVVSPLKPVRTINEIRQEWVTVARTDDKGRWDWHSSELQALVPRLVTDGVVTTAQKRQWDDTFLLLARRP